MCPGGDNRGNLAYFVNSLLAEGKITLFSLQPCLDILNMGTLVAAAFLGLRESQREGRRHGPACTKPSGPTCWRSS